MTWGGGPDAVMHQVVPILIPALDRVLLEDVDQVLTMARCDVGFRQTVTHGMGGGEFGIARMLAQ